jgi:hypothetical protein
MKRIVRTIYGNSLFIDRPNVNIGRLNQNNPFRYFRESIELLKTLSFRYEGNKALRFPSASGEIITTSGYCFLYEHLHQSFYVVFDDSLITVINKLHTESPTWQWRCVHTEADLVVVLKNCGFLTID